MQDIIEKLKQRKNIVDLEYVVKSANEKISISTSTSKEYKKVIGIFFVSSCPTLKMSRINLRIDSENIFINNIMEIHTLHLSEEARTYKNVLFETNVRAETSTIDGSIQCNSLAIGDKIFMHLIYER